jgi:CNT family concentrative nucleoside transporter
MIGVVQPLFGAVVILAIAVAFSKNRPAINWSTVAWGLSLQIVFALIVLQTTGASISCSALQESAPGSSSARLATAASGAGR